MHLSPACFMSVSLALFLFHSRWLTVFMLFFPCTVNRHISIKITYWIPHRKNQIASQSNIKTKLYFKVAQRATKFVFVVGLATLLLLLLLPHAWETFRNLQLTTGNKCLRLNFWAHFRLSTRFRNCLLCSSSELGSLMEIANVSWLYSPVVSSCTMANGEIAFRLWFMPDSIRNNHANGLRFGFNAELIRRACQFNKSRI